MISLLKRNNWLIVKIFVLITITVPFLITAYEIVVSGKDSVMFLGDFPPGIDIAIAIYYAILLVLGVLWVLMQLKSLMQLKNEKKKNELLHLQSQVNPHFFFNMLNNLYGLVDKDSEKAKKLILKLSDLMRYSIYEGEKETVNLNEEIIFLENYIALHKMRYHKDIGINFDVNVDDTSIKVMPLLFIILLENAFKHGVENLREDAFVNINLWHNEGKLIFDIENNFDANELPKKEGIGIKNLKSRLELVYPKKHKLIFTKDRKVYKAQLQLLQ